MNKYFKSVVLSSLLIGTSVFANTQEVKVEEKVVSSAKESQEYKDLSIRVVEDFSKINQLDKNKVKLVSAEGLTNYGITKYVFDVEGYPIKGLLYETEKGLYLPSDFLNKEGVNIYKEDFYTLNKEFIDKQTELKNEQLKKQQEMENEKRAKDLEKRKQAAKDRMPLVKEYLASVEAGKYGDVIRTITGNKDGKDTLYVFTDPLCPYCIMYETGKDLRSGKEIPNYGIRNDLKKYKEIKIVMYPIFTLSGHETSIKRSFWFNEESKKVKTQEELLSLLSKATSSKIEDLVVNEDKFKEYNAFVRNEQNGLLSNNVIEGTPSMFTTDGMDPRFLD